MVTVAKMVQARRGGARLELVRPRFLVGVLALAVAATAADHTSKLKFAACSDDEPLQRFSMGID